MDQLLSLRRPFTGRHLAERAGCSIDARPGLIPSIPEGAVVAAGAGVRLDPYVDAEPGDLIVGAHDHSHTEGLVP
jgi:hypothetical protein